MPFIWIFLVGSLVLADVHAQRDDYEQSSNFKQKGAPPRGDGTFQHFSNSPPRQTYTHVSDDGRTFSVTKQDDHTITHNSFTDFGNMHTVMTAASGTIGSGAAMSSGGAMFGGGAIAASGARANRRSALGSSAGAFAAAASGFSPFAYAGLPDPARMFAGAANQF